MYLLMQLDFRLIAVGEQMVVGHIIRNWIQYMGGGGGITVINIENLSFLNQQQQETVFFFQQIEFHGVQ